MINANLTNSERKSIYRRDGWRCALCDSTDGIQLHHYIHRGEGGSDAPQNVITLCWRCHAVAHGVKLYEDVTDYDIDQACVEYLADMYGPGWNPWEKGCEPFV